ncbi:MAG: FHA domain-containing protein [Bdellovibrio sp.]
MARLKVRLRGKLVYDITLSPERSYIAGRKEDCDIVLQPEKGISREHCKIFFEEGAWQVQVISRYGEVIHNGQTEQQFGLEHGTHFIVTPYEFEFHSTSTLSPEPQHDNYPAISGGNSVAVNSGEGHEKTVIAASPMVAYIKIVDSNNELKEIIRLDAGDSWIAGRDPSCHIQIRDQRVSRRQFEIRRSGSQYIILDLGSVNGTLLNGNPISSTDPSAIKSGDSISVLDNVLYFELHDAFFQNRLEQVNVPPLNSLAPYSGHGAPIQYRQGSNELMVSHGDVLHYPTVENASAGSASAVKPKFDFKKNRPKVIGGAVLIVALAYFLSDGGQSTATKTDAPAAAPTSAMQIFAKLKPEQQALVRQRYKDAKNLYMQGKYQLAQDEIVKLQELVPDFEDVKEIERLSKEAIFIQGQQRRQEEIEKAKLETEEKIQKQANECQKKINPNITMAEMDDCLSSVLQFNPDHPRILELKTKVESLIAAKEAKEAEKAAYQSQVSKLRGLFNHAQEIEKKGKPLDAVAAYEKVLAASLPDPGGLKAQSKRNITSVKQKMNSSTSGLVSEADKFYQAQNLKSAILSLRKARIIDPENSDVPGKIDQYTTELRKQMMIIYQEGILEESFGNVEGGESKPGAKDKWKKILELDVPDGEYYKKAYIKLKKYGAL